MFILYSDTLSHEKTRWTRKIHGLRNCRKNMLSFGELALIDNDRRSATVVAKRIATCLSSVTKFFGTRK